MKNQAKFTEDKLKHSLQVVVYFQDLKSLNAVICSKGKDYLLVIENVQNWIHEGRPRQIYMKIFHARAHIHNLQTTKQKRETTTHKHNLQTQTQSQTIVVVSNKLYYQAN